MNRRWLGLTVLLLLAVSACTGSGPAMETDAPAADAATATPLPPTATPQPPTATPEPATATPGPATPTPMPVSVGADVPYIDDGTWQHLSTLYLPAEAEGPYPTVVIYHSGVFFYGDQEYLAAYEELGRFFAGRGYAVVVPAYRVSKTDPYPAAVEDAFCALAWVYAAAAQHSFDVTRVAALGLDAGADLAALVGTVDEPERYLGSCPYALPEGAGVQGVVAIGGYYDLPELLGPTLNVFQDAFQKHITYYLQAAPEEAPRLYAEASPITWVDGTEPPFAIITNLYTGHANIRERARAFADALSGLGVTTSVIEVQSDFWLMNPYAEEANLEKGTWRPTLEDYGIPQAEAFLAELFGMRE